MSADFWAGYMSGAVSILIGNPLDIIKTKLQAGSSANLDPIVTSPSSPRPVSPNSTANPTTLAQTCNPSVRRSLTDLARGSAAPILFNGALGALLYMTYNRSLSLLETGSLDGGPPALPSPWSIWTAGALGGLATFVVSAPSELIKCRAQITRTSSLDVARELYRAGGLPRIYMGGGITSARDAIGYGFYFWSYELSKSYLTRPDETTNAAALKVLLCGGLAGIVTWASIFPLDVIKTRVQTWDLLPQSATSSQNANTSTGARQPLLPRSQTEPPSRPSSLAIARHAYQTEGAAVFFRGLGVCSLRAFIVNAVQWAMYEWMMKMLADAAEPGRTDQTPLQSLQS